MYNNYSKDDSDLTKSLTYDLLSRTAHHHHQYNSQILFTHAHDHSSSKVYSTKPTALNTSFFFADLSLCENLTSLSKEDAGAPD